MGKVTKLKIARIALVGSILGGMTAFQGAYDAYRDIHKNPNYVIVRDLDNINRKLNSASKDLEYDGDRYPNAGRARGKIAEIMPKVSFDGFLEKTLKEAYSSLPEQNDVRTYHGKNVDDYTFEDARAKIKKVSEQISIDSDWNKEQYRPMKIKERNNFSGLIVSALFGSWALSNIVPRKETQ